MIFNMLGSLEVLDEGRPITLGRQQQRAVLVILLLSANRVVPVDQLVVDLWGDRAPSHPVEAIHVYISRLRRALEPQCTPNTPSEVLIRRAPGYVLHAKSNQVDAEHFGALVGDGQRLLAQGAPAQASRSLTDALALWRGPALAEFTDRAFARPAIRRLDELRRVAVEHRLVADLALGGHASAVAELAELVQIDPLRERYWELLALALYRSGRQAESLRTLARARVVLAEELGLELCPSLRRLEQDILAQAPTLAWHPPQSSSAMATPGRPGGGGRATLAESSAAGRPSLVGRREEMTLLRAVLAGSVAGAGGIVDVSGEPGIGKTRLMEELGRHAAAAGVTVAMASGHDGEGAPSFWPWVQILRSLIVQGDPSAVRTALARRVNAIAPVVGEVLDLMPDAATHPLRHADVCRAAFYDAVVGFLRQLAASRPILVILEDLHWDYVASLELAELLASQVGTSRVMLAVTHRDVGVAPDHPLVNFLSAVARLPNARFLKLLGLSRAEVGEILEEAIGHEPDDCLVSAVYEKTAGNAYFVTELSRLLRSESTNNADIAGIIPDRVRAVIRQRMARLDEGPNKMLALASVVGDEFDFHLLARAADMDEETLLYAIEATIAAGLVIELPHSAGRYRFSHSIVRDTIYEAISGLRRAREHARIAESLAAEMADAQNRTMAIAYHYYQAAPAIGHNHGLTHLLQAAEVAEPHLA